MNTNFKSLVMLLLICLTVACNSTKETTTAVASAEAPPAEMRKEGPPQRGQNGADREARMKERAQKMYTQLNLSEDQIAQYETIAKKYRNEMSTLRENSGGDRQAMRSAMQGMKTRQDEEVKQIMSEEQFALYQKIQEENRQNRRGGRGGRGNRGEFGG